MMFLPLLVGLLFALKDGWAFTGVTTTRPPMIPRSTTTHCGATLEGRKTVGELKPVNNFVLVKVEQVAEATETGILLTGSAKVQKTQGVVISVGPGKTHPESGIVIEQPVGPGDGVVYGKYDGTEIDYDGSKHTLIRDDDVLLKYTDELTLESAEAVRDYVLIYAEADEETESGLVIATASTRESKPSTGEVIKVGPGRMAGSGELGAMGVNVGDQVKFRDFAGNEVQIEGKEYAVVRMADVLAKF